MSGGERGVWPQHLDEGLRRATVNRTRNNAARRVLNRIPLNNPFEVTSELEQAVYMGVERIARLPEGVDYLYQVLIAFKDVSMLLSFDKSGQELTEQVKRIKGKVPSSVFDIASKKQSKFEIRMHETIDQAFEAVLGNPQDFPNEAVREIIKGYLQTRESTRERNSLMASF